MNGKNSSGDDLLSVLASINRAHWADELAAQSVKTLREAADLCGVDAEGMSRKALISAIAEGF